MEVKQLIILIRSCLRTSWTMNNTDRWQTRCLESSLKSCWNWFIVERCEHCERVFRSDEWNVEGLAWTKLRDKSSSWNKKATVKITGRYILNVGMTITSTVTMLTELKTPVSTSLPNLNSQRSNLLGTTFRRCALLYRSHLLSKLERMTASSPGS